MTFLLVLRRLVCFKFQMKLILIFFKTLVFPLFNLVFVSNTITITLFSAKGLCSNSLGFYKFVRLDFKIYSLNSILNPT